MAWAMARTRSTAGDSQDVELIHIEVLCELGHDLRPVQQLPPGLEVGLPRPGRSGAMMRNP